MMMMTSFVFEFQALTDHLFLWEWTVTDDPDLFEESILLLYFI